MFLDTPKTYKMTQEGLRAFRKRYFRIILPLYVIVLTSICLGVFFDLRMPDTQTILIPTVVGVLSFGIFAFISYNRVKTMMESYTIIWDTLTITRQQKGTPDLVLYHGEIKHIGRLKKGGLLVRGSKPMEFISIPRRLEGYAELESLLSQVAPLEPYSRTRILVQAGVFLQLASLAFIVAALVVQTELGVIWFGSIAIVLNGIGMVQTLRNKNISSRTRRLQILRIALILWLAARIYWFVTGSPLSRF